MSRKFSVGQKVRIVGGHPKGVGTVCTVVGFCPEVRSECVKGKCYTLDVIVEGYNKPAHYREDFLAHYYDGNEPVAWTDCVWQPNKTATPTTADLHRIARELLEHYR